MWLMQFNMLWNNNEKVKDVKKALLNSLEVVYKENTSEFIYFVTLYNIFKDYLNELTEEEIVKSKTGFKDSVVWNKLYNFQKDGVLGAIDKLEKYNGCILADSVGLGKTFEALAIIKYYELRNNRVLVLCPKKLRENWLTYRANRRDNILEKDRLNYDVLNHTDLSRYMGYSGDINLEEIYWENYDLIVIDESHNFRNNNNSKDNKETFIAKIDGENNKGDEKVKKLNEWAKQNNFEYEITEFYSDSLADKPLYDISKKTYWIKNGVKLDGMPPRKTLFDKLFWK